MQDKIAFRIGYSGTPSEVFDSRQLHRTPRVFGCGDESREAESRN
jgi:hypothetical protein